MPEVTVTLEDVESKDVNTKRGLGTVYRLKASDGRTYTTFDREIAKTAAELRGKTVVFDYVQSQNGDFTNYNLNGVKAGTGIPEVANTDNFATQPVTGFHTGDSVTSKDTSIARAVALKAAVETVVGSDAYDTAGVPPDDTIINIANIYAEWLLTGAVTPAESLVQF